MGKPHRGCHLETATLEMAASETVGFGASGFRGLGLSVWIPTNLGVKRVPILVLGIGKLRAQKGEKGHSEVKW